MITAAHLTGTKYDLRSRDRVISLINSCLAAYPSLNFGLARAQGNRVFAYLSGPFPFSIGGVQYAVTLAIMFGDNFPSVLPSMRITEPPLVIPSSCRFMKPGGVIDLRGDFRWGPERNLVELLGFLATYLSQQGPILVPQLRPAADVPPPRQPVEPKILEFANSIIAGFSMREDAERICRYGLIQQAKEISDHLCQEMYSILLKDREQLRAIEIKPIEIPREIVRDAMLDAADAAWKQTAIEIRGILLTENGDLDAFLKAIRKSAANHFTQSVLPALSMT